jgi:tetratricopeptide (TPR) repeat protein
MVVVLILSVILPAASATAGRLEPAALERLRQGAAAHPDDPDLAWALVRGLADGGDPEAALGALRRFRERWPGLRPEAPRTLGRLLYETGRDEQAVEVLGEYLSRSRDDAVAHFFRGLALRRLGRPREAAEALERAAALESTLTASALLLQGIDQLQAGDVEEGHRLIEEARGLDPDIGIPGDPRARATASSATRPGLALFARGGLEFDSNVTLDSDLDTTAVHSDRDDIRYLWSGGIAWRPLQRSRVALTLGYRYDEWKHRDISSYDQRSHLAFASLLWRTAERASLRLDGRFVALELDGHPYLRAESIQPNLFLTLHRRVGVLRTFARFERRRYHDPPLLDSLERDGILFGGGLEQILPIGLRPGAWLALQGRFDRSRTNADRDLFGLEGAYDYDRWGSTLTLHVPLPWQLDVRASASVARERYAHRNVVDLITDDGVGTVDPCRRRDTLIGGRLGIGRSLGRYLRLELGWRGTRRISNVDLYDYERHVVGLYIQATRG